MKAGGRGPAGDNRILVEWPLPRDGWDRRTGPGEGRRAARSVTVNLLESPLGWLKARQLISDRQLAAGERLRADWERAQLAPRVTSDWTAPPLDRNRRAAPRHSEPAMSQILAKRRFEEAVAAAGPGLADIAWRVICSGEGMREAEQALGWPARAGRLVLTLALDRLAEHYRIA